MNKTLKLSLLGTLAASSTLTIALPIVSCSNTEGTTGNKLIATVDPDKLDVVYDKYNTEMTSKTTYEAQKQLYESWVTNDTLTEETSPAIEELKTTISFKDINEEDVAWETAVEKLVYGLKVNFPDTKDSVIPPIIINVILKKGYSVTTPNRLSITIDNLGNVVADPISKDKVIIPTIDETKLNNVKSLYKGELTSKITYEAQKTVYDSWVAGATLTVTNAPGFEQLKTSITFKDGNNKELAWDDVIESLVYGPKTPFPSSIGNKIPGITIKANVKGDFIIWDDSWQTIEIDDLGNVVANAIKRIHISYAGSNFTQVVAAYSNKINHPSISYEQQKASYDSWVSNVTIDNIPDKSLDLYKKLTVDSLIIKDENGNTLSQFAVIEKWVYDTKPAFPEGKDKQISSLFLRAVLKPEYVNTNSAFSLTYEITFGKTH